MLLLSNYKLQKKEKKVVFPISINKVILKLLRQKLEDNSKNKYWKRVFQWKSQAFLNL